jgi:hypothetical protein
MRLEDSRWNVRVGRYRQLEIPMQKSSQLCGKNIERKKLNLERGGHISDVNSGRILKNYVKMHDVS